MQVTTQWRSPSYFSRDKGAEQSTSLQFYLPALANSTTRKHASIVSVVLPSHISLLFLQFLPLSSCFSYLITFIHSFTFITICHALSKTELQLETCNFSHTQFAALSLLVITQKPPPVRIPFLRSKAVGLWR
jgi:hypothetical protein